MTEQNNSQGNPIIRIQVANLQGREFEELELPVDPNALYTILPRDLLERLKVPVSSDEDQVRPRGLAGARCK